MDFSFHVQQVLLRYTDKGAFCALAGFEELKKAGVQGDFIFSLLDLFEDESSFNEEEFSRFPLTVITDYVRRTHQYYLTKKLPEIEQSIRSLLENYPEVHPLLKTLTDFYCDYRNHLTEHIEEEEKRLLPYIDELQQMEDGLWHLPLFFEFTRSYSIDRFMNSHHDTEQDLTDVRTAILKYDPPITNQTPYRVLLAQLETFEKDLAIHSMVEDRVLLPRALQLEQNLMKEMERSAGLN